MPAFRVKVKHADRTVSLRMVRGDDTGTVARRVGVEAVDTYGTDVEVAVEPVDEPMAMVLEYITAAERALLEAKREALALAAGDELRLATKSRQVRDNLRDALGALEEAT